MDMKIKVHIIAPYESMVRVIKECLPLFPELDINYSIGDLTKGVEIAVLEEKKGTDVIISRGGTAQLIKKSVEIPVIDVQLGGYDMIRSLTLASNLKEKTAIVGFSNITSGAGSIIQLLDLPLTVFTVSHSEEVAPLLIELKSKGYKQIVGDTVTMKTSNFYGLKGFLIQSGKESVIKSLEDAKLVFSYLENKNSVVNIFEQFILKDYSNIIIMESNSIIYEQLRDFDSNPLSEKNLHMLNADLATNGNMIIKCFKDDNKVLEVTAYSFMVDNKQYKMYIFEEISIRLLEQKGVIVHTDLMNEPIVAISKSISAILKSVESLYRKNEPILLQGDKGTGKSFISNYVHQKLADEGSLLTIDFNEFNSSSIESLPLSKISTVKLKNTVLNKDNEKLSSFINSCINNEIRLFIITEETFPQDMMHELKINKIILPNLTDRKEDINQLIKLFLISLHQNYGTSAINIQSNALKILEEYTYDTNIDGLKNLVKQIALNESDDFIQSSTVEKFVSSVEVLTNDSFIRKGTLKEIEKEIIEMVLKDENYNQTKTAERLGINRATLWRKLKV